MEDALHMKYSNPLTCWDGDYRGVTFRIVHWPTSGRVLEMADYLPSDNWAFYLYLTERQCTVDFWEEIWLTPKDEGSWLNYPYYKCPLVDLSWHAGMTWYSKENGPDDKWGVVKAGCDFGHLWDAGREYCLEGIQREVMSCIDSLHEITTLLWRCSGCDEYGLPDENGFLMRDGYFLHYECMWKQKAEREN